MTRFEPILQAMMETARRRLKKALPAFMHIDISYTGAVSFPALNKSISGTVVSNWSGTFTIKVFGAEKTGTLPMVFQGYSTDINKAVQQVISGYDRYVDAVKAGMAKENGLLPPVGKVVYSPEADGDTEIKGSAKIS